MSTPSQTTSVPAVAPQARPGLRAATLLFVRVVRRAFVRLWGRDVMLYTGGVSFFALLAVFPALTFLIGLYGAFSTPEVAARQASSLAFLLPYDAQALFTDEVTRLTTTSKGMISVQNGFALLVGAYAAHRGFKALLAGLSSFTTRTSPTASCASTSWPAWWRWGRSCWWRSCRSR